MKATDTRTRSSADPDLVVIVRAARAGDREAQALLFARYHRALMGWCLVATHRNRDQALDLLQEVFERVFRSLASLRDEMQFESWLFAIAANLCRKKGAREERRRLALTQFVLETPSAELSAVERGENDERLPLVQELIAGLDDPRLKELVEARYVRGLPVGEIARQMAVPLGTVTVKLMRFRSLARKCLLAMAADAEAA